MGLEKYQQRVNSLPPTQHEPASTVQNSSPEPEVIPEGDADEITLDD